MKTALVKVVVGLAMSAGTLAAYHSMTADTSAAPPLEAPTEPGARPVTPAGRTAERTADIGIGDDGMWLQLGSDGRGAGVEMTDEGMRLWVGGQDVQGNHGSGEVGMDADGMRLWLGGES